ncbi:9875_t:CDS:2, partial [Cetraspora pellucida]
DALSKLNNQQDQKNTKQKPRGEAENRPTSHYRCSMCNKKSNFWHYIYDQTTDKICRQSNKRTPEKSSSQSKCEQCKGCYNTYHAPACSQCSGKCVRTVSRPSQKNDELIFCSEKCCEDHYNSANSDQVNQEIEELKAQIARLEANPQPNSSE